MSLNPDRVRLIRTAGMTDWYFARVWRMSASAIRLARIGVTHPNHPTPSDLRPRMPGRRGDIAVLMPEPVPTISIGRLIAAMQPPRST